MSVGQEGYAYRARVGARVRALPELKEISEFFTAELSAQLADSRSTTTAKLDAPVNKLARLLNSPSIKRVLLNDSLRVDFDRIIAGCEVLVVKGALGVMGAGNTAVLMQLLVGMLDAALARQQDLVPAQERIAVALKVDEAPLVLNRGFAETMALKRSAGLETVACWQTESQWIEPELRDQLDALFAHRVYFATGSVRDARTAVGLTMAEFSDTVRPDIQQLSVLGRPDTRLRLPRHHAIVSWSTPEGRQAPFVAETIPLQTLPERVAFHMARQIERGGRYLSDLRQPHWDRKDDHGRAPADGERDGVRHDRAGAKRDGAKRDGAGMKSPGAGGSGQPGAGGLGQPGAGGLEQPGAGGLGQPGAGGSGQPNTDGSGQPEPDEGYRELVDLDLAHSARRVRPPQEPGALDPDPLDLEILALLASMGHLLSSQIHRRFNPGRAATTTQRRLKRLSDAGMLERLQFHRSDGGGVPMCCAITLAGVQLLQTHDRLSKAAGRDGVEGLSLPEAPRGGASGKQLLRQVRHEVHVAGWAFALERALGARALTVHGARESTLSPPQRSTPDGLRAVGPADLSLPGGRVPHDFLRGYPSGERLPVERFETVRPDATIELRGRLLGDACGGETTALDLLVELDDRLPPGPVAGKLERYDHLLAGWAVHTRRYGRERARPLVVFVCRDRARARECARRADGLLAACRAYAGEYPVDWEYPGRETILFVAERDVYAGSMRAYGVPALPPHVRVAAADGDPRAGEAGATRRDLPVAMPVRRQPR